MSVDQQVTPEPPSAAAPVEHVDVLIVGAGLSGIGAAAQLRDRMPGTSLAVLESREAIGGTWDLFRYPGVRSDSDMFTLGYSWRPWTGGEAIADGGSILEYIRETAREHRVEELVRYRHRVVRAEWSSAEARWTVHAERALADGSVEPVTLTCGFLFGCTGYYRYDEGYTPVFPGIESYAGTVVHPQHWPADLDTEGKRVVVIGSGATAVTLVPALAETAGHVTMLQRSPSYVLALPRRDPLDDRLAKLPAKVAYPIVRWKHVLMAQFMYGMSKRRPERIKAFLRAQLKRQLPRDFDIDTHFKPAYDPWDQRLCIVPDGDLFRSIRKGRASVATGVIETFTEKGIRLTSGEELEADVVVTATGLNLLPGGGVTLAVDGQDVSMADTVNYKGMMFSGVPNFAMTIGYTNASWTLKADLVARYVIRLLQHMKRHGQRVATPVAPPAGEVGPPLIDLQSGYVQRSAGTLPRQGTRAPWRLYQNYPRDVLMLRHGRLRDEGIRFSR